MDKRQNQYGGNVVDDLEHMVTRLAKIKTLRDAGGELGEKRGGEGEEWFGEAKEKLRVARELYIGRRRRVREREHRGMG